MLLRMCRIAGLVEVEGWEQRLVRMVRSSYEEVFLKESFETVLVLLLDVVVLSMAVRRLGVAERFVSISYPEQREVIVWPSS